MFCAISLFLALLSAEIIGGDEISFDKVINDKKNDCDVAQLGFECEYHDFDGHPTAQFEDISQFEKSKFLWKSSICLAVLANSTRPGFRKFLDTFQRLSIKQKILIILNKDENLNSLIIKDVHTNFHVYQRTGNIEKFSVIKSSTFLIQKMTPISRRSNQ